jgi:hypothetical protein
MVNALLARLTPYLDTSTISSPIHVQLKVAERQMSFIGELELTVQFVSTTHTGITFSIDQSSAVLTQCTPPSIATTTAAWRRTVA